MISGGDCAVGDCGRCFDISDRSYSDGDCGVIMVIVVVIVLLVMVVMYW